MLKYIIDENLPYYFNLWKEEQFVHVGDLSLGLKDADIWNYAKKNGLTIVTKDSDFSNRIMLNSPPPKVIHIKAGNMKISELYSFLNNSWKDIVNVSDSYKLVNVFKNHIEGIE